MDNINIAAEISLCDAIWTSLFALLLPDSQILRLQGVFLKPLLQE